MVNNEEALRCPKCKNRFESPRILPCMESICIKCISNIDTFKCSFCYEIHTVPINGFPVNKSLLKVLNSIDDGQILDKNDIEKYRTQVKTTEELVNYFEYDIENAKDEIKKYCEGYKTKIVNTVDQQVFYLNDIRDELVDEVYLYEKDCIKTLEQNSQELNTFKTYAYDCRVLIDDLKKAESKKNLSKVIKTHWKLNSQKKKFRNFLFKNVDLIFKELNVQRYPAIIKRSWDEIDLNNFKHFNIGQNISRESLDQDIKLNQLESKKFVFNYLNDSTCDYILEIRDFYHFEAFSKHFTDYLETSNTSILVKVYKNRIIYHKYSSIEKELSIFDENLEIIKNIETKIQFKDIVGTDLKIFCLKKNLNSINVYDWNLNKLMVIRQNSVFYNFTPKLTKMFATDEYLFFLEIEYLKIITKDGELVNTISLEDNLQIICFFDDCFYAKNKQTNSIDVIDFNGLTINNLVLKNFPHSDFQFFLDSDKNFSCYDLLSFKLYVSD